MPHEIVFTSEAEEDAQAAQDWYADQAFGLDADFTIQLADAIDLIQQRPLSFGFIKSPVRRTPLKVFPKTVQISCKSSLRVN